jgi:predicted metal-dependent enzyme (double-stranded beta helix superfamily)
MTARDWLVTDAGQCQVRPSAKEWELLAEQYYFHRFLTEVIDLIAKAPSETEEWDFLPQIRLLVRKLVTNSYWLQTQQRDADPKTGVAIVTLYDEIGYPLTVQNVTFAPGMMSPIHNHGTWGVTAILKGQEQHTFWQRVSDDPAHPDKIAVVGQKVLIPGEIMSFMPGAIHQVQAIGDEPTVTFQLYSDTQPRSRFEFDPMTHSARSF